jgi:hypothetical protein
VSKPVTYVPSVVVLVETKRGDLRWASMEPELDGRWKKFFGNNMYALSMQDDDFSATLEAFSHWTFQARLAVHTNTSLMLVFVCCSWWW